MSFQYWHLKQTESESEGEYTWAILQSDFQRVRHIFVFKAHLPRRIELAKTWTTGNPYRWFFSRYSQVGLGIRSISKINSDSDQLTCKTLQKTRPVTFFSHQGSIHFYWNTLPETNIFAPEWLEDDPFLLGETAYFQRLYMLVSGKVCPPVYLLTGGLSLYKQPWFQLPGVGRNASFWLHTRGEFTELMGPKKVKRSWTSRADEKNGISQRIAKRIWLLIVCCRNKWFLSAFVFVFVS